MTTSEPDRPSGRRTFLARLSAAAAAFVATPAAAAAGPARAASAGDEPEAWLTALTGTHKQLFHSHDRLDGTVLFQAEHFVNTYGKAYGVAPGQVSVVVAAHGKTGVMLLQDRIWEKYEYGKRFEVTDPRTKAPAVRNPYLAGGKATSRARRRR